IRNRGVISPSPSAPAVLKKNLKAFHCHLKRYWVGDQHRLIGIGEINERSHSGVSAKAVLSIDLSADCFLAGHASPLKQPSELRGLWIFQRLRYRPSGFGKW